MGKEECDDLDTIERIEGLSEVCRRRVNDMGIEMVGGVEIVGRVEMVGGVEMV